MYDAIVAGAGYAGAVCARLLAEKGMKVLVLEKRWHIGGNAYDCCDDNGVVIHKYGPHIFHTNDKKVFDFLSRFTQWNGYQHSVLASVYGKMIPVPFNMKALYDVFSWQEADELKCKLFEKYGEAGTVSILELINEEDKQLALLGKYVYDNIFEKYTVKQWGMKPEDINPATTARVPVRLSDDCRYFTDEYQGLPADGYTAMFEKMLSHENISVKTGVDSMEHIALADGRISYNGSPYSGIFIYTGKIEDLLNNKYGELPYRTLDFVFENHDEEVYQPCGTVNYTVDMPYTRITEFKHMTLQKCKTTTVLKEYSKQYTPDSDEIPYYPIINDENIQIYNKYANELSKYKKLYLVGRLAEYKYYNMDAVVSKAMEIAERCINSR